MAAPKEDRETLVRDLLNEQGYGFQYSVIQAWSRHPPVAVGGPLATWRFLESEYPVSVRGKEIHVDAVFELSDGFGGAKIFAVLETKRPDPAFAEWNFARSGLRTKALADIYPVTKNRQSVFLPEKQPESYISAKAGLLPCAAGDVFDICLERKLKEKGNSLGKKLDDALTQALRAAAGVAQELPAWLKSPQSAIVVPVIVTNATLNCVDGPPMSSADRKTGNVDSLTITERKWLWLSTNVSPSMLPEAQRMPVSTSPNPAAASSTHVHTRGVMVIGESGLTEGLTNLAAMTLSFHRIRD